LKRNILFFKIINNNIQLLKVISAFAVPFVLKSNALHLPGVNYVSCA